MKNFMLILSAAVLMMLAACSKKETPKPVIALTPLNAGIKDVTGKWLATVDTVYGTVNNKPSFKASGNTDGTFFQFNADGTGVEGVSANPTELPFTFTIANGVIIIHTTTQDISLNILTISATKFGFSLYGTGILEDIYFVKE